MLGRENAVRKKLFDSMRNALKLALASEKFSVAKEVALKEQRYADEIELLVQELVIFVTAGFETTSHTMVRFFFEKEKQIFFLFVQLLLDSQGFLLCLLAQHPEVQERARNEAKEVFGTGALIGSETLGQLPYISACFHEALRLFPPALINAVEATEDGNLEGFGPVFKGDLFGIDYYSMNHHPTVFKNPELFLPERYLVKTEEMRERDDAAPAQAPVFSFSNGPHVCLGKFLALLEGRIFTAMLLTHFRLRLPEGFKVEYADENEIVGRCVQGGQVIFETL